MGGHGSPIWEAAQVQGGRQCEAEVGGCARPKWEAEVGGQSGRPKWEAMRGPSGRPCEAEVGGRSGRPKWEAEVGGRARPNLGSLIGSDRSHDKMWEAEAMGGCGRPKVGGRSRPCSPDWLR